MKSKLTDEIESQLQTHQDAALTRQRILELVLGYFAAETGTIHRLEAGSSLLHLVAQVGLPPQLIDVVRTIPVGKGIAGQVVEQRKPVTICNLQTDTSGVARPAAKQTGVGAALCVPIWKGTEIIGTFGIGTRRQEPFSELQVAELENVVLKYGGQFTGV